jgi:nucleotide-binding universal stress UspA family protein
MSARSTHPGVVVGVDGSASSTMAVRWAAREATMRNVPLTLVHVATPRAITNA